MKKILSIVVLFSALSNSAFAGKLIDQALNANLAEKATAQKEYSENHVTVHGARNEKYKSVEILEIGDELGGFVSATPAVRDSRVIVKKADNDKTLERELHQVDRASTQDSVESNL